MLAAHNGIVAILMPPDIEVGRVDGVSPSRPQPESDPARMQRMRELVAEVVAERPATVVIRLDEWLAQHLDERRLRPDGVHFTEQTNLEVAQWLGPALVEAYTERTGRRSTAVL